MRINVVMGFFLPVPPTAGGAVEKTWFRLAREFAARGHDVAVLSRRWPGVPDRERRDGCAMIRVRGFDHTPRLRRNLARDVVWGLRVARVLPPADVTVCNTLSLPVHIRWSNPRAGRVVVVVARTPRGQSRLYRGASRLLAISAAVARRVSDESAAAARRTRVIPLPIDWPLHAAASRAGDSAVTIGYVGRVHPEKGLHLLLEAATRLLRDPSLPPWRLVVRGPVDVARGGGGEAYAARLRATFGDGLGERLRWEPPEFDERRLAAAYASLDVFCYPSVAEGEALGVAPLEAMAAGAVPVVSRLECFADAVVEERNGLSFDHRGPDAAGALASVLARVVADAPLRRELAARAREDVRRFDFAPVADALLEDFAGLGR